MSTSTNVVKCCISCNKNKPNTSFYKHKQMKSGRLNRCVDCVKASSIKRDKEIRKNPELLQKERKRQREKYYRLNYKDKHKPTKEVKKIIIQRYNEKYPEKIKAKNYTSTIIKSNKENQFHHWSYNKEHYKSVIELSVEKHNLVHRFINYDKDQKMYRTLDGYLLDSKSKHIDYINKIIDFKL